MNIPVIYEDDWLLVVDKPAGLLTIPSPKNEPRTLTSILNDDLKERALGFRLHPCHRLDKDTSGLIIYAKGKSIQKKMMDLFKDKKVSKKYLAFISGYLSQAQGRIHTPIEGREAITDYKVIAKKQGFSIIKVTPLTGRTNQIRIHFKQAGHPLLGETKFAFRKDFSVKAKRLCLHAVELEFLHPVTQKKIYLTAQLPQYLREMFR